MGHAGQLHQPLAALIALGKQLELGIVIGHAQVQRSQMRQHIAHGAWKASTGFIAATCQLHAELAQYRIQLSESLDEADQLFRRRVRQQEEGKAPRALPGCD
jgi:hypothetical protein